MGETYNKESLFWAISRSEQRKIDMLVRIVIVDDERREAKVVVGKGVLNGS